RIREPFIGAFGGERPRLIGRLRSEFELKVLALADVADPGIPHRVQRVGDRVALRIKNRGFERDKDSSFHVEFPAGSRNRLTNLIRGAKPLGLPYTLTRCRSLALPVFV